MTLQEVEKVLEKYKNGNISTSEIVILDENGKVYKTLSEHGLKLITQETVDFLISELRRHKDFNMSNVILKQLIDLKKAYYPATQRNVQANVDIFDDQLAKWYEAKKEIDSNKIVVVGEVKEDEIDKNEGR